MNEKIKEESYEFKEKITHSQFDMIKMKNKEMRFCNPSPKSSKIFNISHKVPLKDRQTNQGNIN